MKHDSIPTNPAPSTAARSFPAPRPRHAAASPRPARGRTAAARLSGKPAVRPVVAVDLGPHLSGAELTAFHALCRLQGKAPEGILAAVIRRGITEEPAAAL